MWNEIPKIQISDNWTDDIGTYQHRLPNVRRILWAFLPHPLLSTVHEPSDCVLVPFSVMTAVKKVLVLISRKTCLYRSPFKQTISFSHFTNTVSTLRISRILEQKRLRKFIVQQKTLFNVYIRVITKLPNSEQSYKGKVKTHNYINKQNQSTTGKLWKP